MLTLLRCSRKPCPPSSLSLRDSLLELCFRILKAQAEGLLPELPERWRQ